MVRSHLTENGVMIVNMNMISERENGINAYLQDTIASVFPEVYTVNVNGATNRELFASANPDMLRLLKQRTEEYLALDSEMAYDFCAMMQKVAENLTPYQAGSRILTDDKAPVELLGMQTIDDMISRELSYYKEKFEQEGIAGLIG